MLGSDLKALYDSYQDMYEEGDGISCEMIEEIVEELVEECVEFGYTIDEATTAVANAAILYIDEAKVTYGSDTESPEQRRERAKAKVGEKKAAARKAAVKTAVGRAKAKAAGAAAGASIAASVAKDTARRAARTAVHKVSYGAQKKKEQVKSGVKSLIGKGLRKAAGAVGKVAQKAAGAASRLGEEVVGEQNAGPSTPVKFDSHMGQLVPNQGAGRVGAVRLKPGMGLKKGGTVKEASFDINPAAHKQQQKIQKATNLQQATKGAESLAASAAVKRLGGSGITLPLANSFEPEDIYDLVMEYLLQTGQAETISEAQYVMSQMNEEMIQSIIETRMDPRGRPASGPMNVYAKNKPNTDAAFKAALERVRAADAKKTPEQRKKELDAYKARKENS